MNKIKELEEAINKGLKEIHPDYSIANLSLTKDGKYQFDLKISFDPAHKDQIKKVFQKVLGGFREEVEKVQTKIYLPKNVHQKLKEIAYAQGRSHSEILSECIEKMPMPTNK